MSTVSSMAITSPWQLVRTIIITGLVGALFLNAPPVSAQDAANDDNDSAASDGFVPDSYDFTVKSGDNMTVLVRRALQLYDQAKSDLALSAAQTIYCETNIVQEMGARDLIYPGEKLSVATPRIEQYTTSARGLSTGALAAWQVYADNANFSVDAIPTNVEVTDDGTVSDPSLPDQPETSQSPTSQISSNDQDNATWYWWFIGAGTIAVIWYVLWRREGEPA